MQVAARGCPDVLTKEQVQPAPETRAAMQAVALPVPESHWNEQETGTCPAWQVAVMLSTPLAGVLYPVGTAMEGVLLLPAMVATAWAGRTEVTDAVVTVAFVPGVPAPPWGPWGP